MDRLGVSSLGKVMSALVRIGGSPIRSHHLLPKRDMMLPLCLAYEPALMKLVIPREQEVKMPYFGASGTIFIPPSSAPIAETNSFMSSFTPVYIYMSEGRKEAYVGRSPCMSLRTPWGRLALDRHFRQCYQYFRVL